MALVKTKLEDALNKQIKALESKLKKALDDKNEGIYKAQELVESKIKSKIPTDAEKFTQSQQQNFQQFVWKTISDEWSKVIAKEVISILAEDVSKIVASEVDKYIKSATIIVPPGQAVATTGTAAAQAGATSSPSPAAKIT